MVRIIFGAGEFLVEIYANQIWFAQQMRNCNGSGSSSSSGSGSGSSGSGSGKSSGGDSSGSGSGSSFCVVVLTKFDTHLLF